MVNFNLIWQRTDLFVSNGRQRVVGFNGSQYIHYLSRMTEQLVKPAPSTKDVSVR